MSEKKIKLHDIQPTESVGSSVTGKVCLVCTVNISSYCCPQCFIPYCSSQCYLRHGADCTEAFSRQRVKAVLDLEVKENIKEPAAVHLPKAQYGKFLDESEQILEKVSKINLDRNEIDDDENDPDILDDESMDNNDKNLHADFKELGMTYLEHFLPFIDSLSDHCCSEPFKNLHLQSCEKPLLNWIELIGVESVKAIPPTLSETTSILSYCYLLMSDNLCQSVVSQQSNTVNQNKSNTFSKISQERIWMLIF